MTSVIEWTVTVEVLVPKVERPWEAEIKEHTTNLYATSEEHVRQMIECDARLANNAMVRVKNVRRADEPPEPTMSELRKRLEDYLGKSNPLISNWQVLVVAIKMPSGDVETIQNNGHDQIVRKLEYYIDKYDGWMKLKANPEIEIVDFMLV